MKNLAGDQLAIPETPPVRATTAPSRADSRSAVTPNRCDANADQDFADLSGGVEDRSGRCPSASCCRAV